MFSLKLVEKYDFQVELCIQFVCNDSCLATLVHGTQRQNRQERDSADVLKTVAFAPKEVPEGGCSV